MKFLKPYVMPRPFNGFNIPIAIQTSFIKSYAEQNGYAFTLPLAELTTSDTYYSLDNFLSSTKINDIGIVSIMILPVMNKKLMDKLFKNHKKKQFIFHAILESKVLNLHQIKQWADEIRDLKMLTSDYSFKVS